MKTTIIVLAALLLPPLTTLHADEAAPRRPKHILWLMADQYIHDAFNFAGDKHVPTPNLDKLERLEPCASAIDFHAANLCGDAWRLQCGAKNVRPKFAGGGVGW